MSGGTERVTAAFALHAARQGHDITLVTTRSKSNRIDVNSRNYLSRSDVNVVETIEPSWEESAEEKHYLLYKNLLEREYTNGSGIVWDSTNQGYAYLLTKKYPKMKILHTRQGMVNFPDFKYILAVKYSRVIGVSLVHAKYLAHTLNRKVKCVHNGIELPPWGDNKNGNNDYNKNNNKNEKKYENNDNGKTKEENYLLSLNRISREKGIHHAIDVAIETRNSIKIVGDDTHVADLSYVKDVIKRCKKSRGYAQYYGLVDNSIKEQLLKGCKAVIGCPEKYWIEAFGLYAVEANAYGKPVLAIRNGGLNDIIENGVNGFLADSLDELKGYVTEIETCSPEACRRRVEEMFSSKVMTNNYLAIFEKVLLDDDPQFRW
ncbi:MAG: glycosyltransferase [Thermoproteota archaeon]|nr:glycosyltransferase [Thermoproteota archaeon]